MSLDFLSAAVPTPTDEDCLDLGALFAPLTREELELFLVKLLSRHPEEAGWIVQAANKPVDTLEIHNEVANTVSMATSIQQACDELEAHVERSTDFVAAGHIRNAVAVLEVLTGPAANWAVEQGSVEEMETEEKGAIEGFFANLENAWQSVFEKCTIGASAPGAKPVGVAAKATLTRTSGAEKAEKARASKLPFHVLSKHELDFHLALLNDMKKKLTQVIGPMFSDPIRVLKKKMAEKAEAQPAAAAAASSSSAAAEKVGAKRKSEAAAEEESKDEPAAASSSTAAPAAKQPPTKKTKKAGAV